MNHSCRNDLETNICQILVKYVKHVPSYGHVKINFFYVTYELQITISPVPFDIEYSIMAHFEGIAYLGTLKKIMENYNPSLCIRFSCV